jgi:hypothetical protein
MPIAYYNIHVICITQALPTANVLPQSGMPQMGGG